MITFSKSNDHVFNIPLFGPLFGPSRHRMKQVRSSRGEITGVLDIAKCLYDAVSRLQKAAEKKASSTDDGDNGSGVNISMLKEMGKGKGKKSKAFMQVTPPGKL